MIENKGKKALIYFIITAIFALVLMIVAYEGTSYNRGNILLFARILLGISSIFMIIWISALVASILIEKNSIETNMKYQKELKLLKQEIKELNQKSK